MPIPSFPAPPAQVKYAVDANDLIYGFLYKNNLLPLEIPISPSGDTTGIKDNASINAAYARVLAAGRGQVSFASGIFYVSNNVTGGATATLNSTTAIVFTAFGSTYRPAIGQTITGSGIPANTTIVSGSGNNWVLSAPATATASGVATVLTGPQLDRIVPPRCRNKGAGKYSTVIKFVSDGVATNIQSNMFLTTTNGDGWSFEDMTLDYQFPFDPQQTAAFNQLDSWFNIIRSAYTNKGTINNCVLANAGFHGFIGVGSMSGVRVTNNDIYGCGCRPIHIHAEASGKTRSSIIKGNILSRNGRGILKVYSCQVGVASGSPNVTFSTNDYAQMKGIIGLTTTYPTMIIQGAGVNGGDFIAVSTPASLDDTNKQIHSAFNCATTLTNANAIFSNFTQSGLFVNFGGSECVITDNYIEGENGPGIQISNMVDSSRTVLWTSIIGGTALNDATSFPSSLYSTSNSLELNATEYTAAKAAYTANSSTCSMQIYHYGQTDVDSVDYNGNLLTFTDGASGAGKITFTGAAVNFAPGINYQLQLLKPGAGGISYSSSRITCKNNIIKDCIYGMLVQGKNIDIDNIIDGSKLAGIYFTGGSTLGDVDNIMISGQITNSGVAHVWAPLASGSIISNITLDGLFDGSGSSGVIFNIAGAAGKVSGIKMTPRCRIFNSGLNPTFATSQQINGTISYQGIHLITDGTATYSDIDIMGTFKQNIGGGVKGGTVDGFLALGAVFEDNCAGGTWTATFTTAGTIMTVTSVPITSYIENGLTLTGSGVTTCTVTSQTSGVPGKEGVYVVNVGQTVGSTTVTGKGSSRNDIALTQTSNNIDVEKCRMWNRNRNNAGLAFSGSTGSSNVHLNFKTNYTRNGSNGNIASFGSAVIGTNNTYDGVEMPASCLIQGGQLGRQVNGGAVTQSTNRSTGVTLNRASGTITGNNASLAALAEATFTVSNDQVQVTDIPMIAVQSGPTANTSTFQVSRVAAGAFDITAYNQSAITADTGAPLINFVILKGAVT